jgi:hypothetical protein
MSEWKPIDTAPVGRWPLGTDGPYVELRWHDGGAGITGYFGAGADGLVRWNDELGRAIRRPNEWRPIGRKEMSDAEHTVFFEDLGNGDHVKVIVRGELDHTILELLEAYIARKMREKES